ncbi:MAG: hypothetical protein VB934_13360 [Polyangiaceae bacterium]
MRTSCRARILACSALLLSWGSASVVHAAESTPDAWHGPDKALHFGGGLFIGGGGYGLGAVATQDRFLRAGMGLGLAIAIAAAKEGLDAAGLGQPSAKDFTWSVAGGLVGVGIGLSFDFALHGP